MEPEEKPKKNANKGNKKGGKRGNRKRVTKNDKKRGAEGCHKELDAEEVARQQACRFEEFEVDYSVWYNACIIVDSPAVKGVVLVHKPTYRPFVIIANLPHESQPDVTDIEYVLYTDQLDEGEGYIHQWMPRHSATQDAPFIIEATCEVYMALGPLTPEDGSDHRIALMHFLGMTTQQPNPTVATRLREERRVIKGRRQLPLPPSDISAAQEAGGGMDVDNK